MRYSVIELQHIISNCINIEELNHSKILIDEEFKDLSNKYSSFEITIINKLINRKINELS